MTPEKRRKLEAAGYIVGDAEDFLGLTPAEASLVEVRLALAGALRSAREAAGMTQGALATEVGSSQSRIAKAETADPSVSTDLLLRALFGTGARPEMVLSRAVVQHQRVVLKRSVRRAVRRASASAAPPRIASDET